MNIFDHYVSMGAQIPLSSKLNQPGTNYENNTGRTTSAFIQHIQLLIQGNNSHSIVLNTDLLSNYSKHKG